MTNVKDVYLKKMLIYLQLKSDVEVRKTNERNSKGYSHKLRQQKIEIAEAAL